MHVFANRLKGFRYEIFKRSLKFVITTISDAIEVIDRSFKLAATEFHAQMQ